MYSCIVMMPYSSAEILHLWENENVIHLKKQNKKQIYIYIVVQNKQKKMCQKQVKYVKQWFHMYYWLN